MPGGAVAVWSIAAFNATLCSDTPAIQQPVMSDQEDKPEALDAAPEERVDAPVEQAVEKSTPRGGGGVTLAVLLALAAAAAAAYAVWQTQRIGGALDAVPEAQALARMDTRIEQLQQQSEALQATDARLREDIVAYRQALTESFNDAVSDLNDVRESAGTGHNNEALLMRLNALEAALNDAAADGQGAAVDGAALLGIEQRLDGQARRAAGDIGRLQFGLLRQLLSVAQWQHSAGRVNELHSSLEQLAELAEGGPQLAGLKQLTLDYMRRLEAVDVPDVDALRAQLDTLRDGLTEAPAVKQAPAEQDPEESGWLGRWVKIRKVDEAQQNPAWSGDRQSLRAQAMQHLSLARLALNLREQALWRGQLQQAADALRGLEGANAQTVQTLEALSRSAVRPTVPPLDALSDALENASAGWAQTP